MFCVRSPLKDGVTERFPNVQLILYNSRLHWFLRCANSAGLLDRNIESCKIQHLLLMLSICPPLGSSKRMLFPEQKRKGLQLKLKLHSDSKGNCCSFPRFVMLRRIQLASSLIRLVIAAFLH